MKKAIFIDIDNTLLDFDAYVTEALQSGFEHFGLKEYEPHMFEVFECINNSLWGQVEQGTLDYDGLGRVRFKMVFEALGIAFDGPRFEQYFREYIWHSAILIEGAEQMLQYLSQRYILCTASNGPYEQQLHRLELAGIKAYFNYFFVSEKIGISKPAKAFFERALEEMNRGRAQPVAAADCVMLGDSLRSDIAGGTAVGMQTVWFNRRGAQNTTATMPDIEIRRLEEAQRYL